MVYYLNTSYANFWSEDDISNESFAKYIYEDNIPFYGVNGELKIRAKLLEKDEVCKFRVIADLKNIALCLKSNEN